MVEIMFNQKKMTLQAPMPLSDLLVQQGYEGEGFAVAVNQKFIPRGNHSKYFIEQGDKVDVMTPMQGG